MLFSEKKQFNQREIRLVTEFLEKMIGQHPDLCHDIAENEDFIFLDHWSNKMGFAKEEKNLYIILSLEFEKSVCSYYQLILKDGDQQWNESHIIDYQGVRKAGIIK